MAATNSRLLSAGMGRRAPWAPRIGTYPLPATQDRSLLEQLVEDMPPLGQEPPPFVQPPGEQPAAPSAPQPSPVMMGSAPLNEISAYGPEGIGGSPDASFGLGEPSPNQSLSGVVDAASSVLGLMAGGPIGFAVAPAIMGTLAQRGATQPTMGLTSAIAQIMGYPTLGQIVQDAVSPGGRGALSAPDPLVEQALAIDMNNPTGGMDMTGIGDVLGAAGIAPNPATNPALDAQWGQIARGGFPGQFSDVYAAPDAVGDWSGVAEVLGAAGISPSMANPAAYAGMWGDIAAAGGGGGGGMASAEQGGGYGLGGGEYGGDAYGLMTGGYTGAGADGVVQPDMRAGVVHEGEGVLNARAMEHYGDAGRRVVAALNARSVPRTKLEALVGKR